MALGGTVRYTEVMLGSLELEGTELYRRARQAVDELPPNVVAEIVRTGPWVWEEELKALPDQTLFWLLVDSIERLRCCLDAGFEVADRNAVEHDAASPSSETKRAWWNEPACEAIEQSAGKTSGDAYGAWLNLTRGVLWDAMRRLDSAPR